MQWLVFTKSGPRNVSDNTNCSLHCIARSSYRPVSSSLQPGNAPCHSHKEVKVLIWPSKSPDLNLFYWSKRDLHNIWQVVLLANQFILSESVDMFIVIALPHRKDGKYCKMFFTPDVITVDSFSISFLPTRSRVQVLKFHQSIDLTQQCFSDKSMEQERPSVHFVLASILFFHYRVMLCIEVNTEKTVSTNATQIVCPLMDHTQAH